MDYFIIQKLNLNFTKDEFILIKFKIITIASLNKKKFKSSTKEKRMLAALNCFSDFIEKYLS